MGPRQSEPPPNADLTNDTDLAHKTTPSPATTTPQHPNRSQATTCFIYSLAREAFRNWFSSVNCSA